MNDTLEKADDEVLVEWAYRDTHGVLHTGNPDGVRWTRAQAERDMAGSAQLLRRSVVDRPGRPLVIGPWGTNSSLRVDRTA